MYDLIVIGGGPAGLTSTIYAIRKRLNVLLVTQDLGGKTNYHLSLPWIEEYQVIRGLEIVSKFKSELEYLEFARHMEAVEEVSKFDDGFIVKTKGGGELSARAVIITTGTRQKYLDVPGEKEFLLRGLGYSALSYAPLFIDRKAAVVGDGDLALRSAGELAQAAEQVYLICDESALLDTPLGIKLTQAANVTLFKGYQVAEIKGENFAHTLVLKDKQGKITEISPDGTFIEKALEPNSQLVANLVKLDEQKRIIVDCRNRTSMPGIFAAGDVTTTYTEQVLVAVGEGAKAALSAYDYLLPML